MRSKVREELQRHLDDCPKCADCDDIDKFVARAIAEERSRAAAIADDVADTCATLYGRQSHSEIGVRAAEQIAAKIRKGAL